MTTHHVVKNPKPEFSLSRKGIETELVKIFNDESLQVRFELWVCVNNTKV